MESPTIMILVGDAAWTLGAGTSTSSPSASRHAHRTRGMDDRTDRVALTLTSSSVGGRQRSRRVCDLRARSASGLALISKISITERRAQPPVRAGGRHRVNAPGGAELSLALPETRRELTRADRPTRAMPSVRREV